MNNDKICFIIMPISDSQNYPEGHFTRVYEHLILPAVTLAGFVPLRADDVVKTNYIALDILKQIIESDMVLCDLSSQNPNVLYELGIRQAFNRPVSLIKDKKTKRIFDIQGFRDFEYDENLRVDNVQQSIEKLSETIKSTYSSNSDSINSLISLLSLSPAKIDEKTVISKETELILSSLSGIEKRLSTIESDSESSILSSDRTENYIAHSVQSPNDTEIIPEGVGELLKVNELEQLNKGDSVYHGKFGFGEVLEIILVSPSNRNLKGRVRFNDFGEKTLLLHFAKLRKVID